MGNFRINPANRRGSFSSRNLPVAHRNSFPTVLSNEQRILQDLERKLQQQRELENEIARRKEELQRLQNQARNAVSNVNDRLSNIGGTINRPNNQLANIGPETMGTISASHERRQLQTTGRRDGNRGTNFHQDTFMPFNSNNRGLEGRNNNNNNHHHYQDIVNHGNGQITDSNNFQRRHMQAANFNHNNNHNIPDIRSSRQDMYSIDSFYLDNTYRNNIGRRTQGHRKEVPFRNTQNKVLDSRSVDFQNQIPQISEFAHSTNFSQSKSKGSTKRMDNINGMHAGNDNAINSVNKNNRAQVQKRPRHLQGFAPNKLSSFDKIWQENFTNRNNRARLPNGNQQHTLPQPLQPYKNSKYQESHQSHSPLSGRTSANSFASHINSQASNMDQAAASNSKNVGHQVLGNGQIVFQSKKPFAILDPFRSRHDTRSQMDRNLRNPLPANGINQSSRDNKAVVLRYNNGKLQLRNDQVSFQRNRGMRQTNTQQKGRDTTIQAVNRNTLQTYPMNNNGQHQSNIVPQVSVIRGSDTKAVPVNNNNHVSQTRNQILVQRPSQGILSESILSQGIQKQNVMKDPSMMEATGPVVSDVLSNHLTLQLSNHLKPVDSVSSQKSQPSHSITLVETRPNDYPKTQQPIKVVLNNQAVPQNRAGPSTPLASNAQYQISSLQATQQLNNPSINLKQHHSTMVNHGNQQVIQQANIPQQAGQLSATQIQQNTQFLSPALQSAHINAVIPQVSVVPNLNAPTLAQQARILPVETKVEQSQVQNVLAAGPVWNAGFHHFPQNIDTSIWQQMMFGDTIDPPDPPDPTVKPGTMAGAGMEIEIEYMPTTTTTAAPTTKPTTARKITTPSPSLTTKSNVIHSIALQLASLLNKPSGLNLQKTAKDKPSSRTKTRSPTIAVKTEAPKSNKILETKKNRLPVKKNNNIKIGAKGDKVLKPDISLGTGLGDLIKAVSQNIPKILSANEATKEVKSSTPKAVKKIPVEFLSGKPQKDKKIIQAIVDVAAADVLKSGLGPVLAGIKVKDVLAQQIVKGKSPGKLITGQPVEAVQQIVSVQGDKLKDVTKLLSGEAVTPFVPVDSIPNSGMDRPAGNNNPGWQASAEQNIKQGSSVVNLLPETNTNAGSLSPKDLLVKAILPGPTTTASPALTIDKSVTTATPQTADSTSLIQSVVVDLLSKIRHLWMSSDVAPGGPPTTTTPKPCTPDSPDFSCRGIGMFGDVASVGAWCVDKCRKSGCVESVCQCSCTRPQLGVWQGATTESALGPNDRINTTDVPEEIEPVADKTPEEKARERRKNNRRRNEWRRKQRQHGWRKRRRRTTTPFITTTEEPPEEEEQEDVVTTTVKTTTTTKLPTTTETFFTSTAPFYDVTLSAYEVTMDPLKDYLLSTARPIDPLGYKDEFKSHEIHWGSDWKVRSKDRSFRNLARPTTGYDLLGVNPDTISHKHRGFVPDIERFRWGRDKGVSSKKSQGWNEPDDDQECTCGTNRRPRPRWPSSDRGSARDRRWRDPPPKRDWRGKGRNSGPLSAGTTDPYYDSWGGEPPPNPTPTDRPWGRDPWKEPRRRGGSLDSWRDPPRPGRRRNRPPARELGPPNGWDPRDQWIPPNRSRGRRRFGLRDRWRESTTQANEEENEANDKK